MATQHTTKKRHKKLWIWLGGIMAGIVFIGSAIHIAFQVSPWPSALLIRYEFTKGGERISKALEKYVPNGIASIDNQQYKPGDNDAYLDVFYPASHKEPLPTIVWVHGGGWVSGDKDEVDNYAKIVASRGFTVISVNYTIAPEKLYPTPVLQVGEALRYVQQHAARLHSDPNKIVLAGDSAGSQIVAQVATIITNPSYAREVNIASPLKASRLKAMILNCGAYDLALPNYNGPDGKFLHTVLWAYSGRQDFLNDKNIQHASVVDYVNKDFPPSYITAGNADPLEAQSREFAAKLSSLNVPVETLFYEKDHQPKLQHEYQFTLDSADGRASLTKSTDFVKRYVK